MPEGSSVPGSRGVAGTGRGVHAVAWLVWALAAGAASQLASAPLYVLVLAAITVLVAESHATQSGLTRAFRVIVAAGALFALVRTVLTALTHHPGGEILFRIPEARLPRLLGGFTVGGAVESAVVLNEVADGLVIVAVMAVFGAFNAAVSHHELVRVMPRAFYELGLVVTVALAFVPATFASVAAVREADRARTGGRTVRRGRILRTVVPVLETGMERAMRLAESMDARGFGHARAGAADQVAGWLGLGGLTALAGAVVALVARSRVAAAALGLGGLVLVVAAVAAVSHGDPRPRYRPRRLRRGDLAVIATAVLSPAALAVAATTDLATLRWRAGDPSLPFDPVVAAALLLLAVPAALPRRSTDAPDSGQDPAGGPRPADAAPDRVATRPLK